MICLLFQQTMTSGSNTKTGVPIGNARESYFLYFYSSRWLTKSAIKFCAAFVVARGWTQSLRKELEEYKLHQLLFKSVPSKK